MGISSDIYVATDAAAVNIDGHEVIIQKDVTRVRAGHPLLEKYPSLFKPLTVHYDVERADARPGERRGAAAPDPTPAPEPTPAPAPETTPEPAVEAPAAKADKPTVGLKTTDKKDASK